MSDVNIFCIWITELVPLFATLFSLFYGLRFFFKKGKPLFLQTITMAMGCHALSSIYHLCQVLISDVQIEGFTPAYLGHIGFFCLLLPQATGKWTGSLTTDPPKCGPHGIFLSLRRFALCYCIFPIVCSKMCRPKRRSSICWFGYLQASAHILI